MEGYGLEVGGYWLWFTVYCLGFKVIVRVNVKGKVGGMGRGRVRIRGRVRVRV